MVSTPHQSPDHAACAANLQNAPMQTTPFCATPVAASCGAGSELVRHLGLRWGSHRAQGPRSYQEDRTVVRLAEAAEEPHAYFAVFDGHGGAEAADYAVEHLHPNLMRSAFADVGDALRDAYLRTDAGVLAAAAAIPKKKASNAGAAAVTATAARSSSSGRGCSSSSRATTRPRTTRRRPCRRRSAPTRSRASRGRARASRAGTSTSTTSRCR